MSQTENPMLTAMDEAMAAYRRARPHKADEMDEAFARFDPDSEVVSAPADSGPEPATTSEQTTLLLDPGRQAIGKFNTTGPDTQREAAIAQWPTSGTWRRNVLDFIAIAQDHGTTDEEIERHFAARHQSASARRNELMNDGWIEDSGRRRRTTSGRDAIVWVLTAVGREQYGI